MACAGGAWSRWAGFGGEGHLDRLLGAAFFLLGQVGQSALAEVGERGLEQAVGATGGGGRTTLTSATG